MPTAPRSLATILAELAEVRRYLHDAPPHHAGGSAALRRRIDELEAELARAQREAGGNDGDGHTGTGRDVATPPA